MNDPSLPELDADAKAMLRAFRAEHRLPSDVHDRVWDRVEASVEQERRGRFVRGGVVLGVLAAAAAAVLWLGGGLSSTTASSEVPNQAGYQRADGGSSQGTAAPREPSTAREVGPLEGATTEQTSSTAMPSPSSPEAASSEPAASEAAVSEAEAPASASSPAAKSPRAAKRRLDGAGPEPTTSSPSEPTPAVGSTLAEENRLLGRARAALLDERPEHALSWLREHGKAFPQGVLAEEREALWAVALCEADRPQQGRPAARTFLQAHPDSALAARVRDACLGQ